MQVDLDKFIINLLSLVLFQKPFCGNTETWGHLRTWCNLGSQKGTQWKRQVRAKLQLMLPSFPGLCFCLDPEKSFSCSVRRRGGRRHFSKSLAQGQHLFLQRHCIQQQRPFPNIQVIQGNVLSVFKTIFK